MSSEGFSPFKKKKKKKKKIYFFEKKFNWEVVREEKFRNTFFSRKLLLKKFGSATIVSYYKSEITT